MNWKALNTTDREAVLSNPAAVIVAAEGRAALRLDVGGLRIRLPPRRTAMYVAGPCV